jgi:hypothetical protein
MGKGEYNELAGGLEISLLSPHRTLEPSKKTLEDKLSELPDRPTLLNRSEQVMSIKPVEFEPPLTIIGFSFLVKFSRFIYLFIFL